LYDGAGDGISFDEDVVATHESQEAGQSHNHCMSPDVEASSADRHAAKERGVYEQQEDETNGLCGGRGFALGIQIRVS
jgi:hypothetical protein